jgi:hypothetical protein
METVEKISSFLTLLSLPSLAPAMGRALFDVYARRRHLLAEPTLFASRITLMISLTTLLTLYGILWNADEKMVAWFKWADGDIPVEANADVGTVVVTVDGKVDAEVSGKVDADVSGHVDTN